VRHGNFCDSAFNARPDKLRGVQDPWHPMRAKSNLLRRFSIRFALSSPLPLCVISDFQKLSLTLDPNQRRIPCHPVPREGALAIVTDVGAGSGGRGCAFDEWRVRRTVKSCGPDAPMPGIKFLRSSRLSGATVTTKHGLAGESTKQAVKTIAQGRPGCFR
jgi:hypothetical protein